MSDSITGSFGIEGRTREFESSTILESEFHSSANAVGLNEVDAIVLGLESEERML